MNAQQLITSLAAVATKRELAPGTVLLRENVASAVLIFVDDGELAVTLESGAEVGRCPTGSIVGEVSFLDRGPASATVTAAVPSRVYVLERDAFDQLAERDPRVATELLNALCKTLSARIHRSSDLLDAQPAKASKPSLLGVLRSLFVGGAS